MAIVTDSRLIKPFDIFIPIKGENFDGKDFLEDVIAKKAFFLDVDLGDFAKEQRLQYQIPVIAITGSVGKTTTKEKIYKLLSSKYKTLKTLENQNNQVGVPLTLLKLNASYDVKQELRQKIKSSKMGLKIKPNDLIIKKGDFQVAILEFGMRGLLEIEYLSKIAKPSHVVITNIGLAHIGRLGSQEKIMQAKSEILTKTKFSQKAYLNQSSDYFLELKKIAINNDWQIGVFQQDCLSNFASDFEIEEQILKKVSKIKLKQRMQVINFKGIKFIDDSYNANPQSVNWAIENLKRFKSRKILVLGDMLELGEKELDYHKNINIQKIDVVFTYGPVFFEAGLSKNKFLDKDELVKKLLTVIKKGDVVLLKGSRAMQMEEVIEKIKNN